MEVAEAKHTLRLMQRGDGAKKSELYESEEDVPPMSEEEQLLYRLTYHEAVLPPPEPPALKPLSERLSALAATLGVLGVDSETLKLPKLELLALVELRDACNVNEWHVGKDSWGDGRLFASPEEAFGLTVFFRPGEREGTVTEVRLPQNNLHGALPPSIGFLKSLQSLMLPRNAP